MYIEVLLLAFALSADAFSVALGVGCIFSGLGTVLRLSLSFGFAQFIMPLAGALLGTVLGRYFSGMSYLSAAILFFIAFRMAKGAFNNNEIQADEDPSRGWKLFALACATSIDAFGAGFPLAAMPVNILLSSCIIGVICALCTAFGIYAGTVFRGVVERYAAYLGAAVLVVIGIKMVMV